MEVLGIIGMGAGAFLMYEAYKNQLDPITVVKSILTGSSPLSSANPNGVVTLTNGTGASSFAPARTGTGQQPGGPN